MNNRSRGFTLLEMAIAVTIFAAGAVYIYATFSSVTRSSRTATVEIDLGSQNKRALSRMFNELQATSLTPQDTDGLDSTEPVAVCVVEDDNAAPSPVTQAKLVDRGSKVAAQQQVDGSVKVGAQRQQARERIISKSKKVRFRKVVGYMFSATAGTIMPEWSNWITYSINDRRQLIRQPEGKQPRVVSNRVDALDAEFRSDGTILLTLISATRNPTGPGWEALRQLGHDPPEELIVGATSNPHAAAPGGPPRLIWRRRACPCGLPGAQTVQAFTRRQRSDEAAEDDTWQTKRPHPRRRVPGFSPSS